MHGDPLTMSDDQESKGTFNFFGKNLWRNSVHISNSIGSPSPESAVGNDTNSANKLVKGGMVRSTPSEDRGLSSSFSYDRKPENIDLTSKASSNRRSPTCIQLLAEGIEDCLQELNFSATQPELEKWSIIIFESMTAPARTFHSVQHVFDVAVGADCVQKLAAFFHDVVYYSIDGGLSTAQSDLLKDIIKEVDDDVYITRKKLDRSISMTIDIFGFEEGMMLDKFLGLNEFLSACMAVRCYERSVDDASLVAIICCIETTIPFRKPDSDGRLPTENLFRRLQKVNNKYGIGMAEAELVKIVQRAADLANRDLENFSYEEHAAFLSMTWNLLPESNISLRNTKAFLISDFAFAMTKMIGFFDNLDARTIYMTFRENKEEEKISELRFQNAHSNVMVARKYMRCKGMAISVIAAIAELTGGDAPVSLFLGDLPERFHSSVSAGDYLGTDHVADRPVKIDHSVLQLLKDGREQESQFDIKRSPLASYLYTMLGDVGMEECYKHVIYPMDEEHSRRLLEAIPTSVLINVFVAIAAVAVTRTESLNKMIAELEAKADASDRAVVCHCRMLRYFF